MKIVFRRCVECGTMYALERAEGHSPWTEKTECSAITGFSVSHDALGIVAHPCGGKLKFIKL